MSALQKLALDLKRREEMSPLGKACYLDDLTLIQIMAHNIWEQTMFSMFLTEPEKLAVKMRGFDSFAVLRTIKAFSNYRLAAIENGLATCVDVYHDHFDWISLRDSRDLEPAEQPQDQDDR